MEIVSIVCACLGLVSIVVCFFALMENYRNGLLIKQYENIVNSQFEDIFKFHDKVYRFIYGGVEEKNNDSKIEEKND